MKMVKILAKNENCQNPYEKNENGWNPYQKNYSGQSPYKKMKMFHILTKKNENVQNPS